MKPKTKRLLIQEELVDWLENNDRWNAPYGVLASLASDCRYRRIDFGIAAKLDASILIYSENFIKYFDSRRVEIIFRTVHGFKPIDQVKAYLAGSTVCA